MTPGLMVSATPIVFQAAGKIVVVLQISAARRAAGEVQRAHRATFDNRMELCSRVAGHGTMVSVKPLAAER